jgi:transketolase
MTTNVAPDVKQLERLAALVRYYSLRATTKAGSGHVTSSLSAADVMTGLFFHKLRYDLDDPKHPNNDRVIFSKGHASPLLYALFAAAGAVSEEEIDGFRKLGSPLEGHPTPRFKHVEVATGSLGQGLSVGVGMALNGKYLDKLPYRTYVLLGDSETAEGSVWEAIEIGAYYELDNLTGVIDVNRLGQTQETMYGHDLEAYRARVEAFGWKALLIDGHDMGQIVEALEAVDGVRGRPTMVIARTVKGKGVSFLEDKDGWHGKAPEQEDYERALNDLGEIYSDVRGTVQMPEDRRPPARPRGTAEPAKYTKGDKVATRKAYGNALKRLGAARPEIVVLDGEVKNSTYAEIFMEAYPERYFEMFIAEQNMVGAGLGLSKRGNVPFVSTFGAFMTRAHDQIRMASYSEPNLKLCGSHAGVSIGQDGPSQMALEDLAMFAALADSTVLYPADAVSTEKLVERMAEEQGLHYIRTTRSATPVIYDNDEAFPIGGSTVVRSSDRGMPVRVIDAYSVKPIDAAGLRKAAGETNHTVITVEDHRPEGGLGDAVLNVFADAPVRVHKLAVDRIPGSGEPAELLEFAGISAAAIVRKVEEVARVGEVTGAS